MIAGTPILWVFQCTGAEMTVDFGSCKHKVQLASTCLRFLLPCAVAWNVSTVGWQIIRPRLMPLEPIFGLTKHQVLVGRLFQMIAQLQAAVERSFHQRVAQA